MEGDEGAMTDDDIRRLRGEMNAAHERLQKVAAVGSPFRTRCNAEQLYKLAYQALVRVGEVPQLRGGDRTASPSRQAGGHNNGGTSIGKHAAHPMVHGFIRDGYRCDPRWNRPEVT
jgi:hypothetical protein